MEKNGHEGFTKLIATKQKYKLKSQQKGRSAWTGLQVFGIIGWSVVVPALLGTALGVWLDNKYPQTFSWTLTLLLGGLTAGCFIAWQWLKKENKEIKNE